MMEEIYAITKKYDADYIEKEFTTATDLNRFALVFFKDVAEIYDCVTRVRNTARDPVGFTIEDAPILGLLVRVWKLLKEVIRYYEEDNAELINVLDRPMLEAAVTASFLMSTSSVVMEDYRKCSYKQRLALLRRFDEGSEFFETKAGKRLLASVQDKLAFEGLKLDDFKQQRKNRWKIQGMSFFEIFSEVEHADLYACTYGMMSESIHGSWNESMDWCLDQNNDGSFSANSNSFPADVRCIGPMLHFTTKPYRLWLERIKANDPCLIGPLDWIDSVNMSLFRKFDELYDGR